MQDTKGVDAGLLQSRYRLTKQRAAVLRALEDGRHLSADTILDRVRTHLPGVSLGTIYRTLDILRGIGLVQIFSHAGGAAKYEAALEKHHHLVCTHCGEVTNVNISEALPLSQSVAAEHGFNDVDCALVVTGRCARCANGSVNANA
ncbi:MAG TPA: Fur family transcriptional regulator [Candidatus Lustribacter sp.]|nr:Fur family transcriptional regulator [Candidatus Lustribacter sp.]